MLKKVIVVAVLSAVSVLATATEIDARNAAKQVIDLKDGSIAYVFESGKMGLESKFGNAVVVQPGTMLQTADGRTITMVGDEVALLDSLLQQGRHGGGEQQTSPR